MGYVQFGNSAMSTLGLIGASPVIERGGRMSPATRRVSRSMHHPGSGAWRKAAAYELPPDPASARIARRITRGALTGRPQALVDTAELLVSELVANAVRHAESAPQMIIDLDDTRVRVTVADSSPDTPDVRHASPESEGGRGLLLVETLADAWGWSRTNGGKRVWFTLAPA